MKKKKQKTIITVIVLVLSLLFSKDFNSENIKLPEFDNINLFKTVINSMRPPVAVPDGLPEAFENKRSIRVDPCDLSGKRKKNVLVNIGYGDRDYWSTTNQYGQVVEIYASELVLQKKSEVDDSGRYCPDEAKVSGVESYTLDEGHAIADSLGGVSNSYNITPQDSALNREEEQYQMEEELRNELHSVAQVTEFDYKIKYPNNHTMTPSEYIVSYKDNGHLENLHFANN